MIVRIIFLRDIVKDYMKANLYKHVHVYTRDLSVNRLLMRCAVLRNKIMTFVCVGEIIINVFAHIFSVALGWWTPGVGVDARYRV